MLLFNPNRAAPDASPPQQGVIDDARRRQRLRRRRSAAALLSFGLIAGVAWASSGAATRPYSPGAEQGKFGAGRTGSSPREDFNVRLFPNVEVVGMAGWCEVIEEHGITGGSACGGPAVISQPFVQVYGSSTRSCRRCGRPTVATQVAVTNPRVVAILTDGRRRVDTLPLPGLPYGLRGARMVTRVGASLQPLDSSGNVVGQHFSAVPRQATVRRWHYPARPPHAACELHASALPGLSARSGVLATSIRPFPGQLVGRSFLPCAATEYRLHGIPMKAIIVIDAAQPGAYPADLPSFHALRTQPGIFAGGSLTAMRAGNDAWVVAEQARDVSERILALRHLSATVRVGR